MLVIVLGSKPGDDQERSKSFNLFAMTLTDMLQDTSGHRF